MEMKALCRGPHLDRLMPDAANARDGNRANKHASIMKRIYLDDKQIELALGHNAISNIASGKLPSDWLVKIQCVQQPVVRAIRSLHVGDAGRNSVVGKSAFVCSVSNL